MNNLKGTRTEQNLLKAFVWESQARMRYDYFASRAKKEWLEQIAAIFAETAGNEKEHAKRFFNFLDGGVTEIVASFPAGKIWSTLDNLKHAAEGEHEEWTSLYPEFAKVAKEEGFNDIAQAFSLIATVEKAHELRYSKLYSNLNAGMVFVSQNKIIWKCLNCGYLHEWIQAPGLCPACLHPQAYFQIKENNY